VSLSYVTDYRDVWGTSYVRRVKITLDNAYPNGGTKATNGWAITAAALGFTSSARIRALWIQSSPDGYNLEWDPVNSRLHVYMGDNNNASDSPGIELANNDTSMNAKVVYALAIADGGHT